MKFSTATDDENSPNWEEIKRYVGAAKKAPKHPLQQEVERQQAKKPQHLADGGNVFNVAPDQNDPWGGGKPLAPMPTVPPAMAAFVQQKMAENAKPTPQVPPDMAAYVQQKLGKAPPDDASTPVVPLPGANDPKMPPGAPMDSQYNDQAAQIMGGVTPSSIDDLMQTLHQQNKGAQIGAGIAGIGDAIQSVGGIKGDNMKNAEDMISRNQELALKVPGQKAEIGMKQHSLSDQLQSKDPNSPYSRIAQKTYAPVLKQMGATDQQIGQMSADLVGQVTGHQVTLTEAMARIKETAAYQEGSLGVQRDQLKATEENNKLQRQLEGERIKDEANYRGDQAQREDTKLRVEHPVANFFGRIPGKGGTPAFDHASVPSGQVYQAPDGSWRKKK